MAKVKLTITKSECHSGYCKAGDAFVVEDICPPICMELWHQIYPYVFALQNGGDLDNGLMREQQFDADCPDGGRVRVHGEISKE